MFSFMCNCSVHWGHLGRKTHTHTLLFLFMCNCSVDWGQLDRKQRERERRGKREMGGERESATSTANAQTRILNGYSDNIVFATVLRLRKSTGACHLIIYISWNKTRITGTWHWPNNVKLINEFSNCDKIFKSMSTTYDHEVNWWNHANEFAPGWQGASIGVKQKQQDVTCVLVYLSHTLFIRTIF